MNSVIEEWRPFDTGNLVHPDHEVSSLGRVRNTKTGELIKIDPQGGSVSPHYCVDKTWWRPEVLLRVIFSEQASRIVIEKFQATDWDSEIVENYSIPKRKKQPVKTEQATPIVRRPSKEPVIVPETVQHQPELIEARSLEHELAEILYKPYEHKKPADSQPTTVQEPQIQTPQDRMAQRASVSRSTTVHGVARVLKLYQSSAFKRGYAWELTEEKAIGLMVSSCHYCGCEPGTHNQNGLNGIDRIINSDGYVDGNVVPCCGKCNMMKGQRAPDEFIGHVFSIAEHQREALIQVPA